MILENELLIDSNEVNPDLSLKIPSLFMILQNLGMNGCEVVGAGKKETLDKGLLWVYTRMDVKINRLPAYQEKIKLITYPGKTFGCFYPRHYRLIDNKGNILVIASSINVLIEKETRKLCMNPPLPKIEGVSFPDELDKPTKLFIKSDSVIGTHKVKFSEIDLNGHLNNTKYIETIINLKDRAFYEKHPIKFISINYDKEVKENEEIILKGNIDKDFNILGEVDGKESFKASFIFE